MASRTADLAGAYPVGEAGGIAILSDLLEIKPGLVAIIGGGGKTTLLRVLAQELSGDARVVVATSTKMLVPDWCPVLLDAGPGDVEAALLRSHVVCVASLQESTGKLDAPLMPFSELGRLADYVLVEADGAKGLPLKAHAAHEPVIPECAGRVICVVGVDGVGKRISETCHRFECYARLAGAREDDKVTPRMIARVLNAECLHDVLLVNKVEDEVGWRAAREISQLAAGQVIAGSLRRNEFRCLR